MYVEFIFWQKSTWRLITIFQQNMSKKLFRGRSPWDKLKAPCLGSLEGSVMLKWKAQDTHKPHNHCIEGLLPSQKLLNNSCRCQHHNCQVQALHGAKWEETDSAGPSNKTKQKPHQPKHPGHTKCSSKIIWPCNCTDLRTTCNHREQTLLQAWTSPTAGIFWKAKPRKYFCTKYHKRDGRARAWAFRTFLDVH